MTKAPGPISQDLVVRRMGLIAPLRGGSEVYEHMRTALVDTIASHATLPSLVIAAIAGLKKLDYYHVKAKTCQFNKIATSMCYIQLIISFVLRFLLPVCHPMLRSQWFNKLPDGQQEKEHAEALFSHVFDQYQQKAPKPDDVPTQRTTVPPPSFLDMLAALPDLPSPMGNVPLKDTELEHWFRFEGGRGDAYHPLLWWKVSWLTSATKARGSTTTLQAHAHEFPVIAGMAWDFLAIPGASVSGERLFSASRHLCVDARSALSATTITEAMCAKLWLSDGLFKFYNMKA